MNIKICLKLSNTLKKEEMKKLFKIKFLIFLLYFFIFKLINLKTPFFILKNSNLNKMTLKTSYLNSNN